MKQNILVQICRLLTVAGFLFFASTTARGQMRQVYLDNTQADNEVNKISFYSPSSGFVAFTYWLGYTTDSGRTFTKKYITINNVDYSGYSVNLTFGFGIKGVKAFDQNNIIVYGDYGEVPAILSSSDGGNTFKLVYQFQFAFVPSGGISDMIFPQNDNTGYAANVDQILKTTDRGLTWSPILTSQNSAFDHLEAVDDNNIVAVSDYYTDDILSANNLSFTNNKILKTTNGGGYWQSVSVPAGSIKNAFFLTGNKGWLNIDNNFYYTSNAGTSWTQKNNTVVTPFYGSIFSFINDSTGFALSGFDVIKTSDSGKVWENLPRDNSYSYLGYGHIDLQIFTANQLWAGGGHGFLEISNNGGGVPLPKAYFAIDTTGLITTNTVNLTNYSEKGYSYKWFLNNSLVSTQYNASYIHNASRLADTVTLIVSNGEKNDTLTQYQYFYKSVTISSINPIVGTEGTLVVVTGAGFGNAISISFGGVVSPYFTVVSDTQISAYVGQGASGNVVVNTPGGSATFPGFTYEPLLAVDLPTKLSDTILCKSEKVLVTISNTQANVRYDLLDSLGTSFGHVNSKGGTSSFVTTSISVTGNYVIKASSIDVPTEVPKTFTNKIYIKVEHTRSSFTSTRVNAGIGETFNYISHSPEAEDYKWIFNQDANIASSTLASVLNISYASAGQKTLSLISTSLNGCSDTLTANAVNIYKKPLTDETCYALNVEDSDYSYLPSSPPSLNKIVLTSDNGYIISGGGNQPILKSRYGISKQITFNSTTYLAKYTSSGVLSWYTSIPAGGLFYGADKDDSGNIYVLGECNVLYYLKLPNGDSLKVAATPADTISYGNKSNGFILKLDSAGNYLWHTVIDDPSPQFQGYTVQGGNPKRIKIKGDQIIITGNFLANLAYCKNGIDQPLLSLPNNSYSNDLQNDFVFKINSGGTLLWNMYFQNQANNQKDDVSGIGIDNADNYYISGYYEDQVIIHDVGNINNITMKGIVGNGRSYLLKFDVNGHLLWKTGFVSNGFFGDIIIRDIATDADGKSYITGSSSGQLQITNADLSTDSVNLGNYFLMKFDASGLYKWSAGTKYSYYGAGNSIVLNGGHLYSVGYVASNLPTDTSTYIIASADGTAVSRFLWGNDFFISDFDTSGVLHRLVASGHNFNQQYVQILHPNNLVVDKNKNYVISGMTESYGYDTITLFNSKIMVNGYDGFFCKLDSAYCTTGVTPVASAGKGATRCPGDTATIGSAGMDGSFYCWTSKPAGFISLLPNPVVTPSVTTRYYLSVTNNSGVIAKDSVTITMRAGSIAMAGADESICKGAVVSIGVPATQGDTYQWTSYPAGFTSGLANPSVKPDTTTQYFLSVGSSSGCTGKDTVSITVNAVQVPSVTISASDTNICAGTFVTFKALPVNGGSLPSYQWKANGTNVGTDSTNYTIAALKNGDMISVALTSNAFCAVPAVVTSNEVALIVNSVIPSITITGTTTVRQDSATTLSSSVSDAGNAPAYQWQDSTTTHSWLDINNAASSAISYTPATNGDKIRCVLISNALCATNPTVTSNVLAFTVNVAATPTPGNNGIKLYPNPVTSILTIDSLGLNNGWETLQITSINGLQKIITQSVIGQNKVSVNVAGLQSGMYIAILRKQQGTAAYLKFIKL